MLSAGTTNFAYVSHPADFPTISETSLFDFAWNLIGMVTVGFPCSSQHDALHVSETGVLIVINWDWHVPDEQFLLPSAGGFGERLFGVVAFGVVLGVVGRVVGLAVVGLGVVKALAIGVVAS
jgi:hypothetical protein